MARMFAVWQYVRNDTESATNAQTAILKGIPSTARQTSIVAIGASAGGLQALGTLLAGLPRDFAPPIVVVIHLDPDHQSHLARLLQRQTRLRVHVAKSGQAMVGGSVYVASPDRHLEVRGKKIQLTRTPRVRFSRPSIDRLFTSVAKSYGSGAVAVILSGTGSDGTAGAATIQGEGGVVIAQERKTAQFPAMPENAIRAGSVDQELPVEKIPGALMRAKGANQSGVLPQKWRVILAMLRERFGTDFGGYRPSTLKRRLERRIKATAQPDLQSYIAFIRKKPTELERLHAEFLIKVSSFFRDPQEWEQLARKVVRPLIQKEQTNELRIWSAGCATGEEAYSLAMLFTEGMEASRRRDFKVFATDLDEEALATARLGVYEGEQVAGVSQARLTRHFVKEGQRWRVSKELRRRVIFGRHDLLRDPPLASMDLIVCRNVLIYFAPDEGRAVVQRLANSLRPDGFLFLGRSEGRRGAAGGFERVAGSMKIFHRSPAKDAAAARSAKPSPLAPAPAFRYELRRGNQATQPGTGLHNLLDAGSVVIFGVDGAKRIILWNKAAEALFGRQSSEAMGTPISDVVGQPFWDGLTRAGRGIAAGRDEVRLNRLAFGQGPELRWFDVESIPFKEYGKSNGGFLFVAVDATDRHRAEVFQREMAEQQRRLTSESRQATDALQAANEELETLNEELQSTSEEQQTLNEELESRNEELETVNEELQSLNEELGTLNEEVGVRIAEADSLNGHLRTILDLAPQAIVACDMDNRITFWNSMATKQFRLSETQAAGQNLFDLVPALDLTEIRSPLAGIRRTSHLPIPEVRGQPGEYDVAFGVVRDAAGRPQGYVLRISPASPGAPTPLPSKRKRAKPARAGRRAIKKP